MGSVAIVRDGLLIVILVVTIRDDVDRGVIKRRILVWRSLDLERGHGH